MAIDHEKLLDREVQIGPLVYDDRDILLYNLSIGMGRDPLNESELPFVVEQRELRVVPTFAAVLGSHAGPRIWDGAGIELSSIVHGEERLSILRPLPPSGTLAGTKRIVDFADKGPGKGAILTIRKQFSLEGKPAFVSDQRIFVRGGGGFGGSDRVIEPLRGVPVRAPDFVHLSETRPDQALLYRLNGDRHMLHADPDYARMAGFERPILHGLCTYGIACRAVLESVCEYESSRIHSFDARMSAPVFPGETIRTEIWLENDEVAFRATVPAREAKVLDAGRCVIGTWPIA
jgi:acyl dehydratase